MQYKLDLETSSLQIKTFHEKESGQKIQVQFGAGPKRKNEQSGGITLDLGDPIMWNVHWCAKGNVPMPLSVGIPYPHIWTFSESITDVQISYNGVELVTYNFSDSHSPHCAVYWARDTERIWIDISDSASDQLRSKSGSDTGMVSILR